MTGPGKGVGTKGISWHTFKSSPTRLLTYSPIVSLAAIEHAPAEKLNQDPVYLEEWCTHGVYKLNSGSVYLFVCVLFFEALMYQKRFYEHTNVLVF